MAHSKDSFTKYEILNTTRKVYARSNSEINVVRIGTVDITLDAEGMEIKATLENVLYVSTFNVYLLSSSASMNKRITFLFKDNQCIIKDKKQFTIEITDRLENLFKLQTIQHRAMNTIFGEDYST
jgi:hypothetical protein